MKALEYYMLMRANNIIKQDTQNAFYNMVDLQNLVQNGATSVDLNRFPKAQPENNGIDIMPT